MTFDLTAKSFNRYKVFYPAMYAVESENKDAKLFNCVQVPSLHLIPPIFQVRFLSGEKGNF